MKKIIIKMVRALSKIIKKDENLITIIYRGYSGSNLTPIIERLEDGKYSKYDINIIQDGKMYSDYKDKKISKKELNKKIFNKYKSVFKSELVITTHGFYRLRNDNTMINLWHGIPIKSMALMHKAKTDELNQVEDDYFLSTSEFFNTVMNSCTGVTVDKYHIAGYPRNDYMFNQNGLENLNDLIGSEVEGKIALYMPTYRTRAEDEEIDDNIFGFEDFNIEGLSSFLEENDITLLLKLHPNEEGALLEKYSNLTNNRIILIKSSQLEDKEMDLYKVLNAVDLLITDYSSIYFDYLLLDRPIIFTPTDLQEYRDGRGLLLEPYEFWTPGYKCLTQEDLEEKMLLSLSEPEDFKKERDVIKDLFHEYQDGNSTDRLMELIEKTMEG